MKKIDQIFNQVKYRALLLFPPILIFIVSAIARFEAPLYVSGIWLLIGMFLLLVVDYRRNKQLDNIDY